MGHLQAQEMAHHAPREVALRWHLQSNHYPPVHEAFMPVAEYVIDRAVEAVETGDEEIWDEGVQMPNGLTRTVSQIVEGLHLDAFIDAQLEEELLPEEA